MSNSPILTSAEREQFENLFENLVNSVVDVVREEPNAKIQNLVLMELIGHIALTMRQSVEHDPKMLFLAEAMLTEYLMFLIQTLNNKGKFPEATGEPASAVISAADLN